VLSGVVPTFTVTPDNVVVITVHVIDPALSGLIWDMEIFFNYGPGSAWRSVAKLSRSRFGS
jgi:hypothetical protein